MLLLTIFLFPFLRRCDLNIALLASSFPKLDLFVPFVAEISSEVSPWMMEEEAFSEAMVLVLEHIYAKAIRCLRKKV